MRTNSSDWATGDTIAATRLQDFNEEIDKLYSQGDDRLTATLIAGLQVIVNAGVASVSNQLIQFAGGYVTVTNNATNYITISAAGALVTSTTGRDINNARIARVVAVSGAITIIENWRPDIVGGQIAQYESANIDLVAGEAISAGNAVRMGFAPITVDQSVGASANALGIDVNNRRVGNGITTLLGGTLVSATFKLAKGGSPTFNVVAELRDSAGTTLLATSSTTLAASSVSGTPTDYAFTFNYAIAANTAYRLGVYAQNFNDGSNRLDVYFTSSNVYPGGVFCSGSTNLNGFTNAGADCRFAFTVNTGETLTSVYKSSIVGPVGKEYVGIALNDAAIGGSVKVATAGVASGLSGLTVGEVYYLQATAGTIGLTPGSRSVVAGKSIAANKLLLIQ